MITNKLATFKHFLSWFLSLLSHITQMLLQSHSLKIDCSPFPLTSEFLSKKKKKSFTTIFFTNFVQRLQKFWSTSKCCWQGHNWTSFPLQYRHYQEDDYPWPYYSLPLATLLHLGANLLAHQVLPHSCHCWHFPKLLLERPLACLTQKVPFWLQHILSRRLFPPTALGTVMHKLPPHAH